MLEVVALIRYRPGNRKCCLLYYEVTAVFNFFLVCITGPRLATIIQRENLVPADKMYSPTYLLYLANVRPTVPAVRVLVVCRWHLGVEDWRGLDRQIDVCDWTDRLMYQTAAVHTEVFMPT